jgi:hypothetical protein
VSVLLVSLELLCRLNLAGGVDADVLVIDLGLYCRLSLAGGVVKTWGEVPLMDPGL